MRPEEGDPQPGKTVPEIQFAQARGGRIAFQTWGSGPNVLAIPPMAQNIEMAWESPYVRRMLERLGAFCSMTAFDKRGTGCSDRSSVPGIDERVDDVRAVMDAAGLDRAHMFVQSEGGPMAILFAATYPERTASLILHGSGAATYPPDMTEEYVAERRAGGRRVAELWGTPDSPWVDGFAPSLAGDQEFRTWHQRYERAAATANELVELVDLSIDMDVRQLLPDISVPTLVLHRTGDQAVPVENGREVAEKVPGARIVEFEGNDHFAYAGEIDGWISEMERFITGTVSGPPVQTTTPTLRITTLGRFAVERDGAEVPTAEWGSRLARQLCKRLVAARGWPVTRDELIDHLWPDEFDMRKLGARLSVQLSSVRRVLGGGVIADRQSVRLDLGEVSTDLEDLFQATDDGAVVAAYAGEFLPEDRYEDWTESTRDEARGVFMAAAQRDFEKRIHYRRKDPAVDLARRMIAADGYDESGHRNLVRAFQADGNSREAERAHASWTQVMSDLGIDVPAWEDVS